ncbi:GNAT family N-acetyltransferase [Kerstersia similis]|uniref:GNAT family N-acetyltransferase n=1 Tax=Kerstersia similis TaxID=206505 RepID=UPI0039F02B2F
MITLHPADATMLPELQAIERSAAQAFLQVPDLGWLAESDPMPAERHLEFIRLGTEWVAQDGSGQTSGFLCAEPVGQALHIWELSVGLGHQGQGLGRALLQHAIQYARAHGLREVTLTTFRDVPWNAPFYARLGFQVLPAKPQDDRLAGILQDEIAHGLPAGRRCAMQLALR